MKERPIKMLRGEIAVIDEHDFPAVTEHSWYINNGYPTTRINGKSIHMHTFLIGRAPKGCHTDHINRNRLDNRRSNLRIVSAAENIRNRRAYHGAENPFHGKSHSEYSRRKIGEWFSKPVIQLSTKGEPIQEWASAMEAQRGLGISNANINQVIKGLRKSAGGFLWKVK